MQGYSLKYTDTEVRRKLILIGLASLVVLGAIIFAAWKNWMDYRYQAVIISNYPAKISGDIRNEIEIQLRRTLEMGVEIDGNTVIKGSVRDGSLEITQDGEFIYNSSFLIDIDEYQQTFVVSASWATSRSIEIPDGVTISCPTYDKMKYPGTACVSTYNSSDSIEMYLPYSGKTALGQYFVVKQRQYLDGTSYLEIAIDSCGDQNILDAARKAAWEWIVSINIDPDIFDYELPTHYCPDGAS